MRIREGIKSRATYDKVFQNVWGASGKWNLKVMVLLLRLWCWSYVIIVFYAVPGGWPVILCHGVAYSVKFSLRAESPRDFADLLLSWKHLPNITVYDFARGLATHANLPSCRSSQMKEGLQTWTQRTWKLQNTTNSRCLSHGSIQRKHPQTQKAIQSPVHHNIVWFMTNCMKQTPKTPRTY